MVSRVTHINPVMRAVLVVGAVMGLVVGITYAALSSSAKLTGNTISATAGLQLSTTSAVAGFGSSITGFDFTGVTPGDSEGIDKAFWIKNASTTNMSSLTLHVPTATTFTGGTVEKSKVHVALACTDPALSLTATLAALEAGEVAVTGSLASADVSDCTVTVTMDADAITAFDPGSTTVTSTGFDLRFTGTDS